MVYYGDEVIRFDWAMKRLLRQKANFAVLESFLSELLGEKVVIKRMLESEGNKETPDDKFNRVDVLAENSKGRCTPLASSTSTSVRAATTSITESRYSRGCTRETP